MRVLIADDDPVFCYLLKTALQTWGYEVLAVENGTDALAILQGENPPRLAILDWMMPGPDGPEICRRLRQTPGSSYVYILLLTANTNASEVVEGIDAGADDYIKKPFNPEELQARLRSGKRIVELQEELAIRATHDSLTGLLNRPAILERLTIELDRSSRQGAPVCVGVADIDRFKGVNDTYGHAAGDAVLRIIAARMLAHMRPYDLVGRHGGEEFVLVFPNNDLAGAVAIADRLRRYLAETPVNIGDRELIVTVSLGIAASNSFMNAEDLVRAADTALFKAKSLGRNRVEYAPQFSVQSGGKLEKLGKLETEPNFLEIDPAR